MGWLRGPTNPGIWKRKTKTIFVPYPESLFIRRGGIRDKCWYLGTRFFRLTFIDEKVHGQCNKVDLVAVIPDTSRPEKITYFCDKSDLYRITRIFVVIDINPPCLVFSNQGFLANWPWENERDVWQTVLYHTMIGDLGVETSKITFNWSHRVIKGARFIYAPTYLVLISKTQNYPPVGSFFLSK